MEMPLLSVPRFFFRRFFSARLAALPRPPFLCLTNSYSKIKIEQREIGSMESNVKHVTETCDDRQSRLELGNDATSSDDARPHKREAKNICSRNKILSAKTASLENQCGERGQRRGGW